MKQRKMLLYRFAVSAVLLLFVSLTACQNVKDTAVKPSVAVIKIIETTDTHGALFPFDLIGNKAAETSLAQVYSYVKQEREKQDQDVILLDNGDILQGQPTVYYYNFEPSATGGKHIISDVMNFMKYDAAAPGNHDIEAGHAVYDKLSKELAFPWLAANAVKSGTEDPYFKPYVILDRKGVKIAVMGLITPKIPDWLPENLWKGIAFEDMVKTAEKWMPEIKKENPDVIIGLFHSGVDYTYGGTDANTPLNENAAELVAQKVDGFDVVFAGHDHAGWNKKIKNDAGKEVLIMGGLNACRTAAAAQITVKFKNNRLSSKEASGEIINIKDFQADPEYTSKFAPQLDLVKSYVGKEIGTFTSSVSSRDSMFGDSAFVDIIHRIQLEITGADVSFAAPLSFDTSINKGKVYVRDMFKLYQYENLLYTMELSGREIKDFLEYSYDQWFATMKSKNDHLIRFKFDEGGKMIFDERSGAYATYSRSYNYDSAAGINYTVDVTKPAGSRITVTGMSKGGKFDMTKKYKVAINSYRGNGGGGHLTKGAGIKDNLTTRLLTSTDIDLRFYLQKYIEKNKVINAKPIGNWTVIPADFAKAGKAKDFPLLYKK